MRLNLKHVFVVLLLFVTFSLYSQVVVRIDIESERQLNLLESLEVVVGLRTDRFLVVSVESTDVLSRHGIDFSVLTYDNRVEP